MSISTKGVLTTTKAYYSCMSINSYGLKINTTKIDYIYKTIIANTVTVN